MKKYINTAFAYAIVAMICGVFYREFTKYQGFTGNTTLSVLHTHAFTLGMIMFLIIGAFSMKFKIYENKKGKVFYPVYNIGLILTIIMLIIRGIVQVLSISITKAMDSAISGMAGIGHIILGVGIVFLFLALKEEIKE